MTSDVNEIRSPSDAVGIFIARQLLNGGLRGD